MNRLSGRPALLYCLRTNTAQVACQLHERRRSSAAGDSAPRYAVNGAGILSDGDVFRTEGQMRASERYCDGGFRYIRVDGANHWPQLTAPEKLNPLLLQLLR